MKPYLFTGLLGLVIVHVSLFMFGHELHNYAPTLKKLMGHIAFGACVRVSHFLYLL